jgi:hypothetical protein
MKFVVYPRRVITPDISSICLATRTGESGGSAARKPSARLMARRFRPMGRRARSGARERGVSTATDETPPPPLAGGGWGGGDMIRAQSRILGGFSPPPAPSRKGRGRIPAMTLNVRPPWPSRAARNAGCRRDGSTPLHQSYRCGRSPARCPPCRSADGSPATDPSAA